MCIYKVDLQYVFNVVLLLKTVFFYLTFNFILRNRQKTVFLITWKKFRKPNKKKLQKTLVHRVYIIRRTN